MGKVQKNTIDTRLLGKIRDLIEGARTSVSRHIDRTMCNAYFLIGKYIVEDEQHGMEMAGYADEVLKYLVAELTKQFIRSFSARNLAYMKKFYL
ncbi:MAG: DUF1016 N-terminal domain-containing protein, partial [Lentimicrobiaceae bacterium]|nr:DUF1016 N-terminal domain-containing protein [Lentimicrobiaceae bacterium]